MGIPHATTIAIAIPIPNPSPAKRHNTMSTDFFLETCDVAVILLIHFLDNGAPHKPSFLRNELLVNVKK